MKAALFSIEMSGHGLEEGSREEKVAVLDEDGGVSESERLRLKAILYIKTNVDTGNFFTDIENSCIFEGQKIDDGHTFTFGERESTPSQPTRLKYDQQMVGALLERVIAGELRSPRK